MQTFLPLSSEACFELAQCKLELWVMNPRVGVLA